LNDDTINHKFRQLDNRLAEVMKIKHSASCGSQSRSFQSQNRQTASNKVTFKVKPQRTVKVV